MINEGIAINIILSNNFFFDSFIFKYESMNEFAKKTVTCELMCKEIFMTRIYGIIGRIAHEISEMQNGIKKNDVNKLNSE